MAAERGQRKEGMKAYLSEIIRRRKNPVEIVRKEDEPALRYPAVNIHQPQSFD